MRKLLLLAVAAAATIATAAGTPSLAQEVVRGEIPPPQRWIDRPGLAPAVTDPETRAQMNREIVEAITAANGDEAEARRAIAAIVARYQTQAQAQNARMRPGPK